VRDLKRAGSLGVAGSSTRELKRVASGNITSAGPLKKQKLVNNGSVADLGSGVRLGVPDVELGDVVFKVPELPVKQGKVKGKGKEKDVFGDVSEVARVGKGKPKADEGSMGVVEEAGFEKANKNVSFGFCLIAPKLNLSFQIGHQAIDDRVPWENQGSDRCNAVY